MMVGWALPEGQMTRPIMLMMKAARGAFIIMALPGAILEVHLLPCSRAAGLEAAVVCEGGGDGWGGQRAMSIIAAVVSHFFWWARVHTLLLVEP